MIRATDREATGPGLRGGRTTRLESLTDAVFGFSIALLIVSIEVPTDFDALLETMKGFAGFALSFAILLVVWAYHYRFFRHFKLEDTRIIVLNSILLFFVLFYVYPLKYVFAVISTILGGVFPITLSEVAVLIAIYSAGFAAVFLVFAMMYQHAYRKRHELALSDRDAISVREDIGSCLIMAGTGAMAMVIALAVPSDWSGPIAGFSFFLIAPAQFLNGRYFARQKAAVGADSDGMPAGQG